MGKASSNKKIQRVQRAGVSKAPGQRRAMAFPAAVIGILLVGTVLVYFARDARSSAAAVAPAADVDHWHAAFGAYQCGQFLANVPDSGNDPNGIHTHSDGLIHIHPFGAAASGKNATFSVFADAVGMSVEDDKVVMPVGMGGQELVAGGECENDDGEKVESKLVMLIWPPQATEEVDPDVVTENFGDVRFTEDGQIIVIAMMPADGDPNDVPLPPSVDQLADPLEAEGGGQQEPTTGESTIPVTPGSDTATTLPTSETTAPAAETTVPAG